MNKTIFPFSRIEIPFSKLFTSKMFCCKNMFSKIFCDSWLTLPFFFQDRDVHFLHCLLHRLSLLLREHLRGLDHHHLPGAGRGRAPGGGNWQKSGPRIKPRCSIVFSCKRSFISSSSFQLSSLCLYLFLMTVSVIWLFLTCLHWYLSLDFLRLSISFYLSSNFYVFTAFLTTTAKDRRVFLSLTLQKSDFYGCPLSFLSSF